MSQDTKAAIALFLTLGLLITVEGTLADPNAPADKTGLSATLKACYKDCQIKKDNAAYEGCMIACKKAEQRPVTGIPFKDK